MISELAEELRFIREAQRLTEEDVARAIGNQQTADIVRDIEAGQRLPYWWYVLRFARLFSAGDEGKLKRLWDKAWEATAAPTGEGDADA